MHLKALLVAAVMAFAAAAPAAAKTCVAELSAKSSSRIAGSDADREARAKDNAIKRWVKDAQAQHGIAYRFWWRADDKKFECAHTPKTARCTVTAKPCRVY